MPIEETFPPLLSVRPYRMQRCVHSCDKQMAHDDGECCRCTIVMPSSSYHRKIRTIIEALHQTLFRKSDRTEQTIGALYHGRDNATLLSLELIIPLLIGGVRIAVLNYLPGFSNLSGETYNLKYENAFCVSRDCLMTKMRTWNCTRDYNVL